MKRIIATAALSAVGVLALAGTASADIGDIQELSVDEPLSGSSDAVEVTARLTAGRDRVRPRRRGCAAWQGNAPDGTFVQNQNPAEDEEQAAEGVGASGPNFAPPAGVSDDNPCSQTIRSWDVVVQQNRGSDDFQDGRVEVLALAGTSAEFGTRGPGPFIGDALGVQDTPSLSRTTELARKRSLRASQERQRRRTRSLRRAQDRSVGICPLPGATLEPVGFRATDWPVEAWSGASDSQDALRGTRRPAPAT